MSVWIIIINFQPLKSKGVIFITFSPAWECNIKLHFQSLVTELPIMIEQISRHPGLDQTELC